ncbi:MAG: YbjQ family protein [Ginsengibacter sp.]
MAKCDVCGKKVGLLPGTCDECNERATTDRQATALRAETQAAAKAAAYAAAIKLLGRRTTTGTDLPNVRITAVLGIVRGLSVRSPRIGQGLMASLETIGDGENSALAQMCDDTRQAALTRMWAAAYAMSADGIIACRYDANEVAAGITEVLCYGTAVTLALLTPAEVQ